MTLFDALVHAPAAQATGWALVHLLWQATLIAVALALASALMRKSAASTRYAVACAALAATLVLPVMTGTIMYSGLRDSARLHAIESSASPSASATPLMIATGVEKVASPDTSGWRVTFVSPAALLRAALPWIVVAWAAGVAILGARLLFGFLYTSRIVRTASPADDRWIRAVARVANAVGVDQAIRVMESVRVAVPTVVGWLKPVIVLPAAAFSGLSPEQFETILAHEVAHIRRHDFVLNVLQVTIETLLFYHPAVWWISRQVRIERENCCDDLAVAVCGDPVGYAQALAQLELLRGEVPVSVVASTGGSLVSRIRRLLGRTEERWPLTPTFVSAAGLLVGAALLIVVPVHLLAEESTSKQTAAAQKSAKSSVEIDVVAPAAHSQGAQAVVASSDAEISAVVAAADAAAYAAAGQTPPAPPAAPAEPPAPRLFVIPDVPEIHVELPDIRIPDIPEFSIPDIDIPDIDVDIPDEPVAFAYAFNNHDGKFNVYTGRTGHHVHIKDPDHIVDYAHPSPDDLEWMKELEIDAKYLSELTKAGYGKLTAHELASMKALGVTGDYASRMNGVFGSHLTPRQLTHMRVLGVTPEYASEIRATHYANFSPEDLGRFRVTGVTAETLRKLQAEGKTKLSSREIVRERFTPDMRKMREQMEKMRKEIRVQVLDTEKLRRSMGVSPEYKAEMAAAGLKDLSDRELMRLRMAGVTADYVREMKKAGVNVTDVDRLVRMKMMRVDPSYIAELAKSGYTNLSVDDLIRLRRSGVDAEFLRELRALKEK